MPESNSEKKPPPAPGPARQLFTPAKVNLFLAITGPRGDGFHDLLSLVAPIALGDDLTVTLLPDDCPDTLQVSGREIPAGGANLVLQAADAWRQATGRRCGFAFSLHKRVPPGGGFGGGSSNGAAALQAMNALAGQPLPPADLPAVAAGLGSDCPFFLQPAPARMRGRGELIDPWPDAAEILRDWHLLLVDPGFPVSTADAYARLAAQPEHYRPAPRARAALDEGWTALTRGLPQPILFNNLATVIRQRYPFYDALLQIARADPAHTGFGITGSGSGCFFLSRKPDHLLEVRSRIEPELANHGFVVESRFLCPHCDR